MTKRLFITLLLALCILPGARADEGMWLVQCLDRALEKNMQARGLKLGAREIYNEEAGGLADAIVSLGFYCSGSMISEDGLMITNHHCAYSDVAALSTPEHNYLEEGFWAHSRADEIPIPELNFYFLRKVLDVTDEVKALKEELTAQGKPAGSRRISSIMETKYQKEYGMEAGLASMWAGTKYYLCLYDVYSDVRLVGAPPVTVAAFGGDEDNWEWPQHKADFALYRIYKDGEPLHPRRHLTISRKGYKEGDFAMVIGYPGATQRYASAAEIQQKIYVERPAENRLRRGQMEITRKWMDADPAIRMKYSNHFFSLSNVGELYEGEEACVHRFDVVSRRRVFEEGFRAFSSDNARILDQLDAEYASISAIEQQKVYYRETLVRSCMAARTLMRMGSAQKDLVQQRKILAQGLAELDARLEKEMLAFSVKEFLSNMDPKYFKPIHKELLERFGKDYDAMAAWLWDNSCLAQAGLKPDAEVAAAFKGGIDEDPLYRYIRELSIADLNNAEKHVVESLPLLKQEYTRAMYKYRQALGQVQYPDANSTMRLSYGRVLPLRPRDGVYVHWQSTARGLREKYDPLKYDFCYPTNWKYLLPPPDFPVNFLTDNDITGGNSGSPVLNARGELIGLAFDGNKESLASNYESVPGYNMCVCVDIRYVLWVIQYLGRQDYILQEIG